MSSEGMPTVRFGDQHARWEYRVALINTTGFFGPNIDVNEIGQYLSDAGNEGWELVSVVDVNRGHGSTAGLLAILKRPRRS